MASVHFKRHLIHRCTVMSGSATQATATDGEVTFAYGTLGTFDCRYVQRVQRWANESIGFPMKREDRVLFNTGVAIKEEDHIINITLKTDSSLVEAGPLSVEELLGRNQTPGKHHISVKVEYIE